VRDYIVARRRTNAYTHKMGEDNGNWKVPVLTKLNQEKWFRFMGAKLEGKGVKYVVEQKLEEYAKVATPDIKKAEQDKELEAVNEQLSTLSISGISTPISQQEPQKIFLNIEKKAKFQKDAGTVKFYILQGLDDDDQALWDEYPIPKDLWEYLKVKYAQPSKLAAAKYTRELHDFSWNEKYTIIDAWNKLKELRRKIIAAKPTAKGQYDEEALFLILVSALPDQYQSTVDTLNIQSNLSVDDQLKHLQNKEERLRLKTEDADESAHAAQARERGARYPHKAPHRREYSSDEEAKGLFQCYLCGKPHTIRLCPYLDRARKYVAKKQEEHREKCRYPRPKQQNKGKAPKRKERGLAGATNSDSDGETSNITESDTDSDSEMSGPEVAALTKEQREQASRKHPQSWPVDTGASSHMTDKPHLFRGQLRSINRRPIQVGGGVLFSDQCGTARVVAENGSVCLLKNTLLVPRLGVNLISARRLCKDGIEGHFDAKNMYFKKNNEILIHAQQNGGLYLVKAVSKDCVDMAFPATQDPLHEAETEDSADPDESEEDETTRNDRRYYRLMHRRFGHYGSNILRRLHEVASGIKQIKIPPPHRRICEACKIGKMRKKINKRLAEHKAEALALISIDIAGPFIMSLRGYTYFLEIIDNYTRKVWTIPLESKGDAISKLQTWRLKQERKTGKKVIACRSDNAPELKEVMDEWERKDGVSAEYTTIATSHQNGPAERSILTTENAIRTMTESAKLPAEFWCFAAEADAYIRNRLPSGPRIDEKRTSPEEAYTGIKQVSDHLRAWGCKCYIHVDPKTIPPKELHNKQANRGKKAVFLGYNDSTDKQYWYYSADLGYAQRSSSVEFDESVKGGTLDLRLRNLPSGVTGQGTPVNLMDRKPRGRPRNGNHAIQGETQASDQTPRTRPVVEIPSAEPQPDLPSFPEPGETPLEPNQQTVADPGDVRNRADSTGLQDKSSHEPGPQPNLQPTVEDEMAVEPEQPSRYFFRTRKRDETDDDEGEQQAKRIRAMLALVQTENDDSDTSIEPDVALVAIPQIYSQGNDIRKHIFEKFYALLCRAPDWPVDYALPATEKHGIQIPRSYREAMMSPQRKEWEEAIKEEVDQLILNGTWEEFVLPKGANLVSTKWVFDIKETANGEIERFKARLVARGFSQAYGTDYTETFAPTARMDTLRIFVAIVAKRNLECSHFDIKNAFTESRLKEAIFLAPPEGISVTEGKVLKALRSLYGLKQAGRDWNLLLRDYLIGQCGFTQSLADPCLFVNRDRKLYLLVYVDDILAAAEHQTEIDWFAKMLSRRFNTKNLGEISKVLGMRVIRDRKARTIYLDQEQYLDRVLNKFGVTAAKHKAKTIPATDFSNLRPATRSDERIDASQYQQLIGSLMYAMVLTRPDFAFVLGCLARYMSDPAVHHGHAAKELMRYIRSTISQKIRFGPGGDEHFVIFTDADWANDKSDRKSVSGGVGIFHGGPFCWMSKKQRSVAKSSCESEYIAQAMYASQGQWAAQVFRDLGMPEYISDSGQTVDMRGDNQGALALVKNPHLHERSKHIDVCHHYIRDLAEKKKLRVTYVPTAEMPADGMTKPLARVAFERFKGQLGIAATCWKNMRKDGNKEE
jgi:Reverse transcriptase (RNA-dependent DNA polymerase)/gag-polypeptide of LTR copia-type